MEILLEWKLNYSKENILWILLKLELYDICCEVAEIYKKYITVDSICFAIDHAISQFLYHIIRNKLTSRNIFDKYVIIHSLLD